MNTEPKDNRFRFSHTITLGDLVLAVGFIVPCAVWLCSLEFRAEANKEAIQRQDADIRAISITQQASAVAQAQTSASLASVSERINAWENHRTSPKGYE